ncbi:non-canonical purine NTP pyrophosphatase [Opitutus terrae]|uniref:dITP/XTP pyrophosphatase n=1 Tax=Opitutus terrae (strain DSM 11246 / JCM 15787 / PB90-1) TaxID=452637 RepID=IXTPA_OPITP|nr:non-canonical purine NTP pyrophosphatase [Opitutus terrae]B1ZXD5.1 RecName: Full=dITP/XTP pyrophosphatase; AltName: Full=Non-canonical purine NTP pyrophosphatase; AltName: Full=Non-standard purine NTP pyrophosphatase; AltName: Full=Nucleoside-triphosphate diphosphatase; AltName: Full=Nucleoside-triphosphate pyrophosphatase; Short=NTPase [Opitutus terrae PB90-1]ACB76930.1 non-canonical purine NTP pyrophosphatase, rdgB/HAM1 family [Opitutus terrae PB90-1]
MKLHLASGNLHKAEEFAVLAAASARDDAPAIEIVSARAMGGMPEVVEDTGTFVGNARKKAAALRVRLPAGSWVLADDSGVCVDALHGGPGVESAYYAGPEASGRANYEKLLRVLADVPDERRGAYFFCLLLVLDGAGAEYVFEGRCQGRLLREPRGSAGFGYDPIFVPDGFDRSYAELGEDVKNRISHRARAWAQLAEWGRRS